MVYFKLCLIMSEMANLEIVLGHSGRDDNLNTNSGGYFESLCQIAAWLLGLNPYMYPGFTLKTSTFPQECHLMVPLMTKWSNTWKSKLKQHRKELKPILKVNKVFWWALSAWASDVHRLYHPIRISRTTWLQQFIFFCLLHMETKSQY